MARRPLPRVLAGTTAQLARVRGIARTTADGAVDVLQPLITVGRGLRRLAGRARRGWSATPKDRRGPTVLLVAGCLLGVGMLPFGPVLALIALMGAAGWAGRERAPARTGPDPAETARLQSLYEALVPYFAVPDDPEPLYHHGGSWSGVLRDPAFDGDGRPTGLRIVYPAYFTDGEAASRARIEQVLHAKSGRGREYRFDWDEEANELLMRVLPPLSTTVAAQRFVTAPGETVLGFTDEDAVRRTVPVTDGEESRDASPVIWRTGPRSAEPHLLAVGGPGAGTTTLLRSLALQVLPYGDVLIVEGCGTGEYACLTGRAGVLAVECGPAGARSSLEWAAHETERRLIAINRARQAGRPAPEDTRRPLWILVDRPAALGEPTATDGRAGPQDLLQVPLRHGRPASVTVVVAEQPDALDALGETVRAHTRARVVLGEAGPEEVAAVLGTAPHTTPTPDVPPGRGYVRLGGGPVLRLQVPATPDPYEDTADERHRAAVLALLPERPGDTERPGGTEGRRGGTGGSPARTDRDGPAPFGKPPEAGPVSGTVSGPLTAEELTGAPVAADG
ncbi:hypothetical protein ABT354_30015 [Streptomyces sp. NPDC000594]|uniref:hypothetical protein n=1 Tax=Streptomyces sp. NPDC000594 TaxID=3154261 RepID=UPI0033278F39